MSYTELNKGKLIPVGDDVADVAGTYVTDYDTRFYKDAVEALECDPYEHGLVRIKDEWYKFELAIDGAEAEEFAFVQENEDGSIEFFTCHYNGGGAWIELVEDNLKK